jgi:hypothetical protein
MVDPTSIIIGAAIGGAAGKFVEKAWNQGEKWITNYFKDHAPKAVEKAQQNSLEFLNELAQRVKTLEEQGEQQKKAIEESLNQPDFSILLQKATISSAQTEDKQKHEILARLVADRLSKGSETLFALTSQLACDAISRMNIAQMKILGCLATVYFIRPKPFPPTNIKDIGEWWVKWLTDKLAIYQDITPTKMDYLHLESLSCIKWNESLIYSLGDEINFPTESGMIFNHLAFTRTKIGEKILQLWEGDLGLGGAYPTTVGILIGVYVSDMLLGIITPLDEWEKS